jgi:DNA-binding NarL/FixJ family response regulator
VGGGSPVADSSSPDPPSPRRPTDRELEVLAQVARGRTNRMAGEALGVSEKTVRNPLRSISKKLSTLDRTHSVVLAIEHGWISIPIVPEDEPEPGLDGAAATESRPRGAAR